MPDTSIIREATHHDLQRLLEMGRNMGDASPATALIPPCEESFLDTCQNLIDKPEGIIVVADNCELAGMAAGYLAPAYYNHNVVQAFQMFWWVEDEFRGYGFGTRMRKALEEWARAKGAVTFSAAMHQGLTPDDVSVGEYAESTTMYQKVLCHG